MSTSVEEIKEELNNTTSEIPLQNELSIPDDNILKNDFENPYTNGSEENENQDNTNNLNTDVISDTIDNEQLDDNFLLATIPSSTNTDTSDIENNTEVNKSSLNMSKSYAEERLLLEAQILNSQLTSPVSPTSAVSVTSTPQTPSVSPIPSTDGRNILRKQKVIHDNILQETDKIIKNMDIDVFILTTAGKPVYWNRGKEEEQGTLMGLLQAIDSNFTSMGVNIQIIKSNNQYIYYKKIEQLIFVYICRDSSISIQHISKQIDILYSYILFNTTYKIIQLLNRDLSYDIRDSIGGITEPMNNLLLYTHFHPSFIFNALPILRLSPDRRDMARAALMLLKGNTILCGLLCCERKIVSVIQSVDTIQTADLLLLVNYVYQSQTLHKIEGWMPICLPSYDKNAFLHIYTYFVTKNVFFILITPLYTPQQFSSLSLLKDTIMKHFEDTNVIRAIEESNYIGSYTLKNLNLPSLQHFVFVYNKYLTMPQIEGPYKDKNYQLHLWRLYQHVYNTMLSENITEFYENDEYNSVYGEITSTYTIIAVYLPFTTPEDIYSSTQHIMEWINVQKKFILLDDIKI